MPCPVGQSSASGYSACVACSAGKYASGTGTPSCISCPQGRYQGRTGQTRCNDCSVGKYSGSTRALPDVPVAQPAKHKLSLGRTHVPHVLLVATHRLQVEPAVPPVVLISTKIVSDKQLAKPAPLDMSLRQAHLHVCSAEEAHMQVVAIVLYVLLASTLQIRRPLAPLAEKDDTLPLDPILALLVLAESTRAATACNLVLTVRKGSIPDQAPLVVPLVLQGSSKLSRVDQVAFPVRQEKCKLLLVRQCALPAQLVRTRTPQAQPAVKLVQRGK